MKNKIAIYLIISVWMVGGFFIRDLHSRNISEEEQLIRVGIGAYHDGFYDIAEKQFSQFVRNYPNHQRIYEICYLLGKTLLNKGKEKEAEKVFLKIINEGKRFEYTDYALFWVAEIEMKSGRATDAYKVLLFLINKFPKFEWIDHSYYLLGLLDFKSGKFPYAEASFKKVLLLSKRDELIQCACFWLGVLSYKESNYEAAIGYFKKISGEPRVVQKTYSKYALFWLGGSQLKLGRFDEAKLSYKAFYERFSNDPLVSEAYWRVGVCEYRLGNVHEAIEILQMFKKQFKDPLLASYTYYLLGEMFLMNGDYASSIKELNLLFDQTKESILWGVAALTLFWDYAHLGDMEGVNRIFQRLQKMNSLEEEKTFIQWLNAEMIFSEGRVSDSLPYYFNILNTTYREKALFRIGQGYFFENKFREAITNFDILLLEFPNSQSVGERQFMKGECFLQLRDVDQALGAFDLCARENRNNPWRLFALTQSGMIYLSREEKDKAEGVFKGILDEFPNHPLSYHAALQLGNLYFKKKNMMEAISQYTTVLKGNILELSGEASFGLGEIFYQQGRYEKALTSFETAIRYFQEDSIWFFLAQLEVANLEKHAGKYEEAKKLYRFVLDHSKDEEMRKAAKELLDPILSY